VIRRATAASAALAAVCANPATASGGAHVVDDAAVEAVGVCHLESWVSRTGNDSGLINAAPACTFRFLPTVEVGGAVQHNWSDDASPTTRAGPSVKWLIHAPDRGPSVALLATAKVSLRGGGAHSVGLVVPMTFVLSERTRLNLNGGWTRTGRRDSAFYGAQIEQAISPTFGAMGEVYRLSGATGLQTGLRWTPTPGWFDVDLLTARETGSPVRLTIGLTLRR
jgi:hypothetical protein